MEKKPKRRGRSYLKDEPESKGLELKNIRWSAVVVTATLLIAVVFALALGIKSCSVRANKEKVDVVPTATQQAGAQDDLVVTTQTPEPGALTGESIETAFDLSDGIVSVQSEEKFINTPDVFGHEMVYSAGTGSLLEPVLKTLYLYDLDTGTETKLATVQLKNGEIFETVLNASYIAWLETDQQGKNAIYVLERTEGATPKLIKECAFAVPKLRLSQDFLIWVEQDEDKEERLYVVDLVSEENASIPGFAESMDRMMTTYGVSAPGIYDTQVIWAAQDPNQSEEDSILNGEKSAIYHCDITMFAEDDYAPSAFSPNMYVHDPVTNGQAWAWIDKNKAPDSALYLRVGEGEVVKIADGVITYALGEDMLIFGKDGGIYAYFYNEGTFARLNGASDRGILPVVSGRRVTWFNKTGDSKDELNYIYVPITSKEENADG